MTLIKNGFSSKLASKDKRWWLKLSIALILSNILFFLFFHENEVQAEMIHEPGKVEIRIPAELFTSFEVGKKILIINRKERISRSGVLMAEHTEDETKTFTVKVSEEDADEILNLNQIQIIPFIHGVKFKTFSKRYNYEVRY